MPFRDFALLVLICLIWAVNAVLSRHVIAGLAVPALFFAFSRFVVSTAVLFPRLLPLPRPLAPVLLVGLLVGAGHFGLLFAGFSLLESSTAAVLLQAGIPMTALLSMLLLKERPGPVRLAGIALAFAGVVIVLWQPGQGGSVPGAVLVLLSAASLALGSVLLKRLVITPLQLQAWTGFVSMPVLAVASFVADSDPLARVGAHWAAFAGQLAFSALLVTVFSHTAYYRLLQRHDASLVSPLTLMFPLMTVALGIGFLGERPGTGLAIGAPLVLAGVAAVLWRPRR